jgi:hypothetical protein
MRAQGEVVSAQRPDTPTQVVEWNDSRGTCLRSRTSEADELQTRLQHPSPTRPRRSRSARPKPWPTSSRCLPPRGERAIRQGARRGRTVLGPPAPAEDGTRAQPGQHGPGSVRPLSAHGPTWQPVVAPAVSCPVPASARPATACRAACSAASRGGAPVLRCGGASIPARKDVPSQTGAGPPGPPRPRGWFRARRRQPCPQMWK